MGHLVADDQHADAAGVERRHLRLADGLRHLEEVRGELGVEVDPVVDLGAGHHQRVAGVHRVDREERHALRRLSTRTRRGSRRR